MSVGISVIKSDRGMVKGLATILLERRRICNIRGSTWFIKKLIGVAIARGSYEGYDMARNLVHSRFTESKSNEINKSVNH